MTAPPNRADWEAGWIAGRDAAAKEIDDRAAASLCPCPNCSDTRDYASSAAAAIRALHPPSQPPGEGERETPCDHNFAAESRERALREALEKIVAIGTKLLSGYEVPLAGDYITAYGYVDRVARVALAHPPAETPDK